MKVSTTIYSKSLGSSHVVSLCALVLCLPVSVSEECQPGVAAVVQHDVPTEGRH